MIVIDQKDNEDDQLQKELDKLPATDQYVMKDGESVVAARSKFEDFFEKVALKNYLLLETIANCKSKIKQTQLVLVGFKRSLKEARRQLARSLESDSDLSDTEDETELG